MQYLRIRQQYQNTHWLVELEQMPFKKMYISIIELKEKTLKQESLSVWGF